MTTTLWIVGIIFGIICGVWIGYTKAAKHIIEDASKIAGNTIADIVNSNNDTLSCTRNCKQRRTTNDQAKEIGRKLWEEEMKTQEVEDANVEAAESARDNSFSTSMHVCDLTDMGYTEGEAREATMKANIDHILVTHPNHKPIILKDGKAEFVEPECDGDDCGITFGKQ